MFSLEFAEKKIFLSEKKNCPPNSVTTLLVSLIALQGLSVLLLLCKLAGDERVDRFCQRGRNAAEKPTEITAKPSGPDQFIFFSSYFITFLIFLYYRCRYCE